MYLKSLCQICKSEFLAQLELLVRCLSFISVVLFICFLGVKLMLFRQDLNCHTLYSLFIHFSLFCAFRCWPGLKREKKPSQPSWSRLLSCLFS